MSKILGKLAIVGVVVFFGLFLTACGNLQDNSSVPGIPEDSVKATVLSAAESWEHIGEYATVEYYTANAYQSAKGNIFLNEKSNYRTGFTTVIFNNVKSRFSGNPLSTYGYKTIRTSGLIELYEGHPEIIAESPNQIEVVK